MRPAQAARQDRDGEGEGRSGNAATDASMNSRRSYLESMNTGRPRRSTTSLEQLNRTLDELEGRIEGAGATSRGEPVAGREWARSDYGDLARSLERNRAQEQDLHSARQIASELDSLRRELRHQFGGNLKEEFAALRAELSDALQSAEPTRQLSSLSAEFERLAGMIHHLGERGEDSQVNLLRLEMEQVKNALDQLAREDTVRSVDRRWDDFDRRWEEFAARVENGGVQTGTGEGVEALAARLEDIGRSIADLPTSVSIRSMEDKLRILASAVDQFAYQQDKIGPEALEAIDERLNEISRAIAATGAPGQGPGSGPDQATVERIEARIASLARQIEELVEISAPADIGGQIETLTQRIDAIARRVDRPDGGIAQLGEQIAGIAARLEAQTPEHDLYRLVHEMDGRFARISNMLEQRHEDAMAQGRNLFHELEQRLRQSGTAERPAFDAAGLHPLESRLEEISARLGQVSERAGMLDSDLVAGLEANIAALSRQLAQPGASAPALADIHPRLDEIEQAIARNREELLEAARHAAQQVAPANPETGEPAAIGGLAQDLKALEDLARRADERNSRTFEAIHDTLIKIVDRLSAMAAGEEAGGPRGRGRIEAETTPPLDPDLDDHLDDDRTDMRSAKAGSSLNPRTPATAAQEAAAAARADKTSQTEGSEQKPSIFGRLTGAIGTRKPKAAPLEETVSRQEPEAPAGEFDETIDPQLANQPLEPGSDAPDLNAIMRRVRDERKDSGQPRNEDTAKSDFIAAARRAAQAAAAEADIAKRGPAKGGKEGRLAIGRIFKHRKKTLTLGIALIALTLTGLYVAPRFLAPGSDGSPVVGAVTPAEPVFLHSQATEFSSQAMEAAARKADAASATVQPVMALETGDQPLQATEIVAPAASPTGTEWLTDEQPDASGANMHADDAEPRAAAIDPALLSPDLAAGGERIRVTVSDAPETVGEEPGSLAVDFDIPEEVGSDALRQAAADGDARALYEIATRYQQGRGVEADAEQAAIWFERAAERGLAPAQYQIGNINEKGLGVERDIEAAMAWYERAASQGNASAMHNLAVLHAMGASGRTDNRQAARWFQDAADLGVTDSQFNLGILAARGVGMDQNLVEAYKWFDIVARAGDGDAGDKRDEVGEILDEPDLERARQTAALWEAGEPLAEANRVDTPAEWTEDMMATASLDVEGTVRSVQTLLNELGYDAGPEDGMFGARTTSAIAAFQGDNELEQTGEIDGELVRALIERQ